MAWYEEADLQRARAEGWDAAFEALEYAIDGYYAGSLPKNPYSSERDGEKRYGVPCCTAWGSCTTDIERIGDEWFRISNGDRYNLPVED